MVLADPNFSQNEPPSVIDEDLLRKAVEEQGPQELAAEMARKEGGIEFAEVTKLRLDFRNILEIDNLWCFKNVVHLQLSNNVIEKIRNLDVLVLLTHLDLSFNNIEKIENLSRLTKLEDLIVYNNQISLLENMDALKNLRVFSVGNNKLSNLRNIQYLRRFKSLKSVCLSGNPFCKDQDHYLAYACAFLPNLEFLDFFSIDPILKKKGQEENELEIMQVEEDDRLNKEQADIEEEFAKNFAYHKSAFVENLDGCQLFDAMYEKDVEGRKFNTYKDIGDDYELYRVNFTECCRTIFDAGIRKHKEKQKELDDFYASVDSARTEIRTKSRAKVNDFLEYKAEVWSQLENSFDKTEMQNRMLSYNDRLTELSATLLEYEMTLVDQLEEIVSELLHSAEDMHSVLMEYTGGRFSTLRDLENQHHDLVLETAGFMADRAAKHEEEEGIDIHLQALIADKVSMIGVINTSHDLHLLVIDARQDALGQSIRLWQGQLSNDLFENLEVSRDRDRVAEIYNFIDYHREEGDELASDLLAAKTKHVSIFLE